MPILYASSYSSGSILQLAVILPDFKHRKFHLLPKIVWPWPVTHAHPNHMAGLLQNGRWKKHIYCFEMGEDQAGQKLDRWVNIFRKTSLNH